jgi:hypothetical protein
MGPENTVGATMARRNLLLAGCGALALAGCTTAQQAPQQPAWAAYYGLPRTYAAPVRSYTAPQSALPYYGEPNPAARFIQPQPQAPSPAPPPVASRPFPPRIEAPALQPADPDCGWWDPCQFWAGT